MSLIPSPGRRSQPGANDPLPALNLYSPELSRNLRVDSISRLQPTAPRSVEAGQPVSVAVETMRQDGVGCVLVTRAGRLVGVFTERDLLTRVLGLGLPLGTLLAECLTANPVTVHPKDSVRTAIQRMEAGGFRHLPVVDEHARPVGILSARRVMHYLVEHFPGLVYNQPPRSRQFPETADGA